MSKKLTTLIEEWFPNKSKKRGYFVAFKKKDGEVRIGWSLYNKAQEDQAFDSYVAKALAYVRADAQLPDLYEVPYSMRKKFIKFINRCEKYFRTTVNWR